MEDKPWWPSGIIQSHDESSVFTKWGTTPLHVPNLSIDWWNELDRSWGEWPEVNEITEIRNDQHGIWLDIGDFEALVCPIPTGNHSSRLAKNMKIAKAISNLVDLPVAGSEKDGDYVLIYSKQTPTEITGKSLAKLHNALIDGGWSTPNEEKNWNDRLKSAEDLLQTNTLWRAPHSKYTIGIPKFNLQKMRVVPVSLNEKLIWRRDTNLPILRQAVEYDVVSEWMNSIEEKYRSNSVMRTSTGGLAHMRYDVEIFNKARYYIYEEKSDSVDEYLSKVDRFQAKLGLMRLLKMGVPLSIFGLISTLWLSSANHFENATIGYATFSIIGFISSVIYRKLEPDWRHEL